MNQPARSASILGRVVLILTGAALFFGAALALWAFIHDGPEPGQPVRSPLSELLPNGGAGWQAEDLPLGDTEMLSDRIEQELRYDEMLFRNYSNGPRQFAVYVAYWRPGKITPRDVEFHTPDRCWIHAGWSRQAHDMHYQLGGASAGLKAGQWRVFDAPGTPAQEVVFWHVVDGEVDNYSDLQGPSDWEILGSLFSYGVKMKREQYFIRVSSAEPMSQLMQDAFFRSVMDALKSLGLSAGN